MRVLIFTQYYPPEVGATQNRLEFFARSLAEAGHHVTVVAEVPNHPSGIIFPQFRRVLWRRGVENGVRVVRVWVKTGPIKTFWVRLGFYLTYALNGCFAAFFLTGRKHHVVFASSPPLTVGLPALAYSFVRRVPFMLDVRDLWPILAVEMGEMSNSRVIALARKLEMSLYRNASMISVVTKGFAEYVKAQGCASERVIVLPNGTVPEIFHSAPVDTALRASLGLRECSFVVGFYGNHGIAQGLEQVLEAAALLKPRSDIHFLFVGEGPVKASLIKQAQQLSLTNVTFHAQVPQTDVLRYITLAGAVLVPLKKLELLKTFIPSKLFDFMACAKPVLLQVDGEARDILDEAGAGMFVPPGDSVALADAIAHMAATGQSERDRMGRAGLEYVHKHYLRRDQAATLERVLTSIGLKVNPS